MYQETKQFKKVRWLLVGVLVTKIVTSLLFDAVLSFLPAVYQELPAYQYIRIALISLVTFLVPLWMYGKGADVRPQKGWGLGEKMPKLHYIIALAITGQFVMMLLTLPTNILYLHFTNSELPSGLPTPFTVPQLLIGIVCIALIPAVLEELLFRGIVAGELAKQSSTAALFFPAIMFTVIHTNIHGLLAYLFLGLMLGLIYLKTRSVLVCVIYHAISNIIMLLINYVIVYMDYAAVFISLIIGVIAFAVVFTLFMKATPSIDGARNRSVLAKNIVCLPTILCFVIAAVYIYYFNLPLRL